MDYKLKIYIHIVELLLETQNHVEAEVFLNRASLIMPELVNPQEIDVSFKVLVAH